MADRDPKGPNNQSKWARISKSASLWVFIILVPIFLLQMMGSRETAEEFQYTRFRQELERGNVASVTFIEGRTIEGELRTAVAGEQTPVTSFRTELPVRDSEGLLNELEAAGVNSFPGS